MTAKRDEIARILEIVAKDGLPGPRDLDVAIDAIFGTLEVDEYGEHKLQQFKAYVHQRLDEAGVPTHPDGPHSKAGCRIGDRLNIALATTAK